MEIKTICDRMREIRNSRKFTKKKMSDFLGCTITSYSRYEIGEREIGIKSLVPIYHMGINLNWLITGEGEMELDKESPSENELIKSLAKANENSSETALTNARTTEKANKIIEEVTSVIALMSKNCAKQKDAIFLESIEDIHGEFEYQKIGSKIKIKKNDLTSSNSIEHTEE